MATATRNLASKSDEFASTARAKEEDEGGGGGEEEKEKPTHTASFLQKKLDFFLLPQAIFIILCSCMWPFFFCSALFKTLQQSCSRGLDNSEKNGKKRGGGVP